jgi:7-cyano-7-deazaguanine synthase
MGGGIDSTALIPYLKNKRFELHGLHFDYGQRAAAMERKAVLAVGRYYHTETTSATLRPMIQFGEGGFLYRNATLALAAAQSCSPPCLLAMGIHSGTPFYDCGPAFFELLRSLLGDYSGGTLRLVAPWLNLSKAEVIEAARRERVPLELTYSCQEGGEAPCGSCLSCLDRKVLL